MQMMHSRVNVCVQSVRSRPGAQQRSPAQNEPVCADQPRWSFCFGHHVHAHRNQVRRPHCVMYDVTNASQASSQKQHLLLGMHDIGFLPICRYFQLFLPDTIYFLLFGNNTNILSCVEIISKLFLILVGF